MNDEVIHKVSYYTCQKSYDQQNLNFLVLLQGHVLCVCVDSLTLSLHELYSFQKDRRRGNLEGEILQGQHKVCTRFISDKFPSKDNLIARISECFLRNWIRMRPKYSDPDPGLNIFFHASRIKLLSYTHVLGIEKNRSMVKEVLKRILPKMILPVIYIQKGS